MASFKLFILTTFLLFSCCLLGAQSLSKYDPLNSITDFSKQESKSSLIFNGSLMHKIGIQNDLSANYVRGISDYYLYPLNAGLGIYYQYQIYKESYVLSGINYQICHIATTENGIQRFRYNEPSFSVCLKHYFHNSEKIGLFTTMGLSFGLMKLMANEAYGHITWSDSDINYIENYSNDDTFTDLIFNGGIVFPSSHVEIAPTIGCRIKDNWMGFYRHRFFYGISINYQLKFLKK